MSKKNTVVIFVVVVVLAIAGGVGVYSYIFRDGKGSSKQETVQPTKVVKSEFVPDTREMSRGVFKSVVGGKIVYKKGDETIKFPLNDEIMIICTEQNLDELTKIDYQKEMGKIYSPDVLGTLISEGQPIVVISQDLRTAPVVHTVVVSTASCPE